MKVLLLIFMIMTLGSGSILAKSPTEFDHQILKSENIRKRFITGFNPNNPRVYGGNVLFKHDLKFGKEICQLKNTVLMIDHEGGTVNRIGSKLKSPSNFDSEYFTQFDLDMKKLKSLCVDWVLGPTIDTHLGSRSYSGNLENNFNIAYKLSSVIYENDLMPVIKHFPGFVGGCDLLNNSKEVYSCDDSIESVRKKFSGLSLKDQKIVMTSLNTYKGSANAFKNPDVYRMIRGDFRFEGLVITDAIQEVEGLSVQDVILALQYNDMVMLLDNGIIERLIPFIQRKLIDDYAFYLSHLSSLKRIESLKLSD